jgi:ribosome-binding factor A
MDANIPKSQRQLQVEQQVLGITQDFFQRESSGASMITVTRTEVSRDMKHGTIFITVLPESKEDAAINFAKRMRSELRHFVMKRLPVKVIPFFEVEIDFGEKNRLHVDELLRKEKKANEEYQAKITRPAPRLRRSAARAVVWCLRPRR